jgi:hypothetical protein
VEVIGNSAPALNQAIECWAALLTRAIADNSRTFSKQYEDQVGREVHSLHDWGLLAEALKQLQIDPDFPNPGALLATAIEDAHRLENLGCNWFHADYLEGKWDQYESLREKVIKAFLKKVQELDYAHAWALLLTVRWFWEHSDEGVDMTKDEWWTLRFRGKWSEIQSDRQPERIRTALDEARKVYELARARLEEHESLSKRATHIRAQLQRSQQGFQGAQARLKELERRPASQDPDKLRSQIDQCRQELEGARADLRSREAELARVEDLQAGREELRAECKSAEQQLKELERRHRDWLQMRAELEHARKEFQRSEAQVKRLEAMLREAS